jgi:MoaA/NifB/PqqE/SkfB family radical SAM enzyme
MSFDLEPYLSEGMEHLVKNILRLTLANPRQSAFFLRYAAAAKKSAVLRHESENRGEHIPLFLIASITDACNLSCAGCYAMANRPHGQTCEFSAARWSRVFDEAEALGISVILLAGGEPLLRRDVLESAAQHTGLLFPVFTNGTLLSEDGVELFDKNRNLVPILSLEGDENVTDARRGRGVFEGAIKTMKTLSERGLLFGVSITVTSENLETATDPAFLSQLESRGCKAILFVEYVPVENASLALNDRERKRLARRVTALRSRPNSAIVLSFPGDEASSGGCLAAGRGFFHISADGGAEPCPFSPYSDVSLAEASLREALSSPLFTRLRADGILAAAHSGGCVLFEKRALVEALLSK